MSARAFALLTLLGFAAPAAAAPELTPLSSPPIEGAATQLLLRDDGAPAQRVAVTAVYRENAHASLRREQAIGLTDDGGSVTWTPDAAGVVVLQWEGGSENVSVLHDGTPFGGLVVAILAGLALLGGSVLFFLQMLRQPDAELIEELEEYGEPPST
jgi:hypothetical protein